MSVSQVGFKSGGRVNSDFKESCCGEHSDTQAKRDQLARARMNEAYGKLPLSFEANQGQTDEEVKFLARGQGYTLFLTSTEAVFALQRADGGWRNGPTAEEPEFQIPNSKSTIGTSAIRNPQSAIRNPQSAVLRMKLVGANPEPQVVGAEDLPGKSNYFIGNDPKKWRTNIPNHSRVEYQEVYPGTGLVYYGNHRQLEYDFMVAPGADPTVILLDYQGADQLEVDSRGDLLIHTGGRYIRQHKPVIYQEEDGVRQEIAGGYVLKNNHQIGFEIGAYDADRPLVIDPTLVYSTYLGGGGRDEGRAIAVDTAGNAYVTGLTSSLDFPRMDPLRFTFGGGSSEVFVTKLNPAGTGLIYSTYLGGNLGDEGNDIAVDGAGNVYVAGFTGSTNFPLSNPVQAALGGGAVDAFVAKLNPAGNTLIYSTYLGGSNPDDARAIAVDQAGNAYLTGNTGSSNFPTANPLQPTFRGGTAFFGGDAFVAKLDAAGSRLVYSTYLGGTDEDIGLDIAVDGDGNAYVVGDTRSIDFPTQNPRQANNGGGQDAFVAKLNPTGSTLVYSTYLGGSDFERGLGIALDDARNAYVTGFTRSANFPNTILAFQRNLTGLEDAFVTKLNAAGSGVVYSTFLGGGSEDQGLSIAVDTTGSAYVTGVTISTDFRTDRPLQATFGGVRDAFVTKLNGAGRGLVYSTYLGGSGNDAGFGIAVDAAGNAYVTGMTTSSNFPTASARQMAFGGGASDAFVTKISDP